MTPPTSENRTATRVTLALVAQQITDLAAKVDALQKKVEELNDWMHTAKGGLIVICTLFGAAVSAVFFIFRRT